MPDKTVSILGCGWLGLPLAENLLRARYHVKGSTTTPQKRAILKKRGIDPYLINCQPQIYGDGIEEFFDADVLFLNIPFRRNLRRPETYKEQVEAILLNVEVSGIELVIFASSTSVYPEANGVVTETDCIPPHNPRSQVLLDIEERLLSSLQTQATIVRFAGMYAEDRYPGVTATDEPIENGDSPVNVIHRDDCVGIVTEIIQLDCRGEIFNACADKHPTRRELYGYWAAKKGMAPPAFLDSPHPKYKIVSNEKFERTGFRPSISIQEGIAELIKGYQVIRKGDYSNV